MGWSIVGTLGSASSQGSTGIGPAGPRGQDAASWLTGTAAPAPSDGKAGDYWLQQSNGNVWQKQQILFGAPPSWQLVANITGPAGSVGSSGGPGPPGRQGETGLTGQGIQGTTGVAGVPGHDGAPGAIGATWLSGTVPPVASQGRSGDFYFQTNGAVWVKSTPQFGIPPSWSQIALIVGAQGVQGLPGNPGPIGLTGQPGPPGVVGAQGVQGTAIGVPGQKGQNGATWLIGTSAPAATQGNVGDLYFQTTQTGGGSILIPGPQGNPGREGPRGSPGANIGSDGALWVPPNPAAWSAITQNGGIYSVQSGPSLLLYGTTNNIDNWNIAFKTITASTPYNAIFYLKPIFWLVNFSSYGIFWRDSATNHFKSMGYVWNNAVSAYPAIEVAKGLDGTAHVTADYFVSGVSTAFVPYSWLKLKDDGTNQSFHISPDGINWMQMFSHARNTDVTPNQIGFFCSPRNSASLDTQVALWSYFEG